MNEHTVTHTHTHRGTHTLCLWLGQGMIVAATLPQRRSWVCGHADIDIWLLILCHRIITPPFLHGGTTLLLHVFVRSWTTQPTTPSLITAFHLSSDTETRVLVLTSLELSNVVVFRYIHINAIVFNLVIVSFIGYLSCAQVWDTQREIEREVNLILNFATCTHLRLTSRCTALVKTVLLCICTTPYTMLLPGTRRILPLVFLPLSVHLCILVFAFCTICLPETLKSLPQFVFKDQPFNCYFAF